MAARLIAAALGQPALAQCDLGNGLRLLQSGPDTPVEDPVFGGVPFNDIAANVHITLGQNLLASAP